jgi:hypothetical protein
VSQVIDDQPDEAIGGSDVDGWRRVPQRAPDRARLVAGTQSAIALLWGGRLAATGAIVGREDEVDVGNPPPSMTRW